MGLGCPRIPRVLSIGEPLGEQLVLKWMWAGDLGALHAGGTLAGWLKLRQVQVWDCFGEMAGPDVD